MRLNDHHINQETCERCGLCVEICPDRIIGKNKSDDIYFRKDRFALCMRCGHCMAICPAKSVIVPGLSYEKDFFDLPKGDVDWKSFFTLISTRRAVRTYKKKPVPRDVLEKIAEAISLAPMGFPPHKIEITIISRRDDIEKALPFMVKFYEDLQNWISNPVSRFFMKRRLRPEVFNTLRNHVVPMMKIRLPDMKNSGEDIFTRGAPVLFLFHANRGAENHSEDLFIALTYGFLAAHALGLGATAVSLVPPAVERIPELRNLFKIPDENEVLGSFITGYLRHRFKRGIRRQLGGVTWV
ncbi:MAG: nitroreductase family protein [Deltaproteobacteria bacterium]|nr:nitroreductase family protein [Deltaproteobacteria bacterium]